MSEVIPAGPAPVLLIIDGHAYAYRAFHAIRSLNGPDGAPTNAIFGFVKMTLKMINVLKPTHLLVVWDAGLAAERMAILPEYKSTRPPTPEGLERQFPELLAWLAAARIASWQREGTEADDWIGTYAQRADQAGFRTIIASSDKDFMQLVSDRVGIFNPNDKTEKIWTAADVEAKTGVLPERIVDWLSLIGDAVDNIPGVPGVGPKTATDLLKRFGTAESVLTRLMEIKADKLRADLLGAAQNVRRNQEMIRLQMNLEGGPELAALALGDPDKPQLRELYRRYGFKGLLAEISDEPPLTQSALF
ncbi:MAG TPA: 5'-3' exonuclease H3TH domain-containing protein [Candidatus Limnocylindria bacterium]|nr:5'-3' exonuclease H3TH domain-containing protein [Candidatus Limnocylindria bacterium]